MADDYNGTIVNAFCSLADVEDVTKDGYDEASDPTLTEVVRAAELDANNLTMWLTLEKHANQTAALVSETSIEGKALRRLNALRVARITFRDRPAAARSPSAPSPADLDDSILFEERQLLEYYKSLTGARTTLGTDITDGNTAPRTSQTVGASEDMTRHVTNETKW